MKFVLLTIESHREAWFQSYKSLYEEKLNHFIRFEFQSLKSNRLSRAKAEEKKRAESDLLIQALKPDDWVVLLDEEGQVLGSVELARRIEGVLNQSSFRRIVFVVGGAFGASEVLKKRAKWCLQMGPWTLNHLVAQAVLLEQLYRSLTIIRGLPYHND